MRTGCLFAMVGIFLAMFGIAGPQWPVLVLLLFFAGLLLASAPPRPRHRPASRYGFDPRQLRKTLGDEIASVAGRVPPEVYARLTSIWSTLREILPRLDRLPVGSPELYSVQRTVDEYLPTALNAYLALPPGYVSTQPGSEGKTALAVLLDELDLLDGQMKHAAEVIHRSEMDRLVAHGRFLRDRFTGEDVREEPARVS